LALAVDQLNNIGTELKRTVRIQFVNEHGLPEAGVDGGGLFKDFLDNLAKEAFDPRVGLFLATAEQRLYPNPASRKVTGANGNIDRIGSRSTISK
jgi:ubiquitin-protein ligase E3 C